MDSIRDEGLEWKEETKVSNGPHFLWDPQHSRTPALCLSLFVCVCVCVCAYGRDVCVGRTFCGIPNIRGLPLSLSLSVCVCVCVRMGEM